MLGIAYVVSWSVAAVIWATGGMASSTRHLVGGFAFMLGPATAAVMLTRGLSPSERREVLALRLGDRRWLFRAWVIPAVLVGAATLGSLLVPETSLRSPAGALREVVVTYASEAEATKLDRIPAPLLSGLLVFQAFVVGPFINAPFMLSEELGWRGYLWDAWASLGFAKNAVLTGLAWGVWHAPLIAMGHNYPDAPLLGIGLMTIFCLLLTPILHHVRERGGSIAHACIFHGTINAGASLGVLCIRTPTWVGRGIVGLPGLLLCAAATVAVVVTRRRRRP